MRPPSIRGARQCPGAGGLPPNGNGRFGLRGFRGGLVEPARVIATMVDEAVDRDVYCPHCAYNLRGVASSQCPECGQTVDRTILAQSILPWAQRKRLGWIRAYWRTVWLAVVRSKRPPA